MNSKNQNNIELLKDLISIPSFSGKENKSADRIENWFRENGIKCSRHKNNIYAFNKYYDKKKKTLLLNSHHDTVKPNEGYTKDPFNPEMSNGKIELAINYIGIDYHYNSLSKGVIDSRDIIYFLSLNALFLLLTIHSIRNK